MRKLNRSIYRAALSISLLFAVAFPALPVFAQTDFSELYAPEVRDLNAVMGSRLGTGQDIDCPPETLGGKYMIHVDGVCKGDIRTGRAFYDEWRISRRSSSSFQRASRSYTRQLKAVFGSTSPLPKLGNEAWVLKEHERFAKEFNGFRAERNLLTTLQTQFMMNYFIANGYAFTENLDLYQGSNKYASTGATMNRDASEPHIAIRVHLGFAITHANGDRFPWTEQDVEDVLNHTMLANVTQFSLWERVSASGNRQARDAFAEMARKTGQRVYGIDLTRYELDGFGGLDLK